MPFRFRYFSVEDTRSTLRVGTDSMILGAWSTPYPRDQVLDIGTGCGVLALMMAQKTGELIDAIDSDEASVSEARDNFLGSPWKERLQVFRISLQAFALLTDRKYPFIICNPPFFSSSPVPLQENKRGAKHTGLLNHQELLSCSRVLLTPNGKLSLIMPNRQANNLILHAESQKLYLHRLTQVIPIAGKPSHRTLIELSPGKPTHLEEHTLTILSKPLAFSPEYLQLTQNFHFFGS